MPCTNCRIEMNGVDIIELPRIFDKRGNLTFFENSNHIPFNIKRTYWICGLPGGENRDGHAYMESHELIVALSGSLDVVLHNGRKEIKYSLNRSYVGLYVQNLTWRHLENFSTNSLVLIVSNMSYNSQDYIRDFNKFKKIKKCH